MTYEEIVAYAKKKIADADVSGHKGHLAVQVNITGEGEGAFYVELNDDTVAVEPYEYFDRDAILIASADVFKDIMDGKKDAVAAYLTGGLKVEGSLEKAKEFGNILKNKKKKVVKKAPAKTVKTAKKAVEKAVEKAPAATADAAKTTKTAAKKATEATKKAAVATAKKVVAKKDAQTK